MSSLSFPDVNVWFALLYENHQHRETALRWWETTPSDVMGMCRLSQMGLLRLMTTSAAMAGKPLTMIQAWDAYHGLFQDSRLAFFAEPPTLDEKFESLTQIRLPSTKVWADAFLLAFARCHGGELITFDQALLNQPDCQVLQPTP
ncbi:MAG: PIN domain-containing protein [Bryobacterales bacterium]|nr:PIN domain-containing protein [Bryobacterales bacterium]